MMEAKEIPERICRWIDILVEAGKQYEGLFPSLIDLKTHRMLEELPPAIEGQRPGDRAFLGNNLMHDHTTLETMYAMSEALGRTDYAEAADRYLERFATHCTDTVTGLFPWGEHAFWHLLENRVGDSHRLGRPDKAVGTTIHDHLRQAPIWLWEKLYGFNPRCVERFAEGLDYHFKEGEPREYIRHARIERKERLKRGPKSADFPRHGGFYILDWSLAYVKTGCGDFLRQIEGMVDYWWPHRDEEGLLLIHTRCPEERTHQYQVNIPPQTISLAASLLEASQLLEGQHPELAERMRERGTVYAEGFLAAPHDPENGVCVLGCRRGTDEIVSTCPIWGSVYGTWPASYTTLVCLCVYRMTKDEAFLRWAEGVGRSYIKEPMPDGVAAPATDGGMGLELLVDLYDLTGDSSWLEGGFRLAEELMAVYLDGDLPRGASGIDWYESQMGPGDLLHGLARLALLATDRDNCPLAPNYTGR